MAKGEAQLCGMAARGVTQPYNVQRSEHQTFAVNRYASQPSDMDRATYLTYSMGKDTHHSYDMARDVGHHFEIPRNATPSFDMSRNLTQSFQPARGIQPQFEMSRGGVQLQCDMSRGVAHPFEQHRVSSTSYDMAQGPQGYETSRGSHQYDMPRTQPYEMRANHPLQVQHQYNYDKGYQENIQPQDTGPAKDQPQFLSNVQQNVDMPLEMPKTAPQRTVRVKGGQKTSGHPYDFAKGYAQQLEMAKKAAQSTIQAKMKAQKNERARQEAALAEKTKHVSGETKSKDNAQPSEILKLYVQQLQTVKEAAKSGAGKASSKHLEKAKTGLSRREEGSSNQYTHFERRGRQKVLVSSCENKEDEDEDAGSNDVIADDADDDSEQMDEEGDPPPFEMAKYMAQLSKTRTDCIKGGQECNNVVSGNGTTVGEAPDSPRAAANLSGLPLSEELMENLSQPFESVDTKGEARTKRDRQELTIANKAKLIQQVETRGVKKKADIAREWGVRPSTLSTIMKNKDKILTQFKSQRYAVGRRRMRTAAYPDVEEALLTWFRHARAAGIPITGPVLQGMGVTLAQELGHPEFSCSVGWLDRFKARHGLSFNPKNSQDSGTAGTFNEPQDRVPSPSASTPNESDTDANTSHSWFPPAMPAVATGITSITTENSSSWLSTAVSGLSNNSEETDEQLSKWSSGDMAMEECSSTETTEDPASTWLRDIIPALLKKQQPKDIFSAGEAALFYNLLPDRSLAVKGEDGHKWTWVKERITLLVAVNMDGSEKLPLFVIGQKRASKSKDGADADMEDVLPLSFETNDSALMTSVLFEGWLRQVNRQCRASNRVISIIMESCPAHSCSEDFSNVELVFLPSDTSSRLQPVERGVIHALKSLYRRSVLERLVDALEAGRSYEVTLHEAMELLQRAWKEIKVELIIESFKLAGLETAEDPADGTGPGGKNAVALLERARRSGLDIPTDVTFESYLKVDSEVQTTVEQERESERNASSDGAACPISPSEALHALATLQKFIEDQDGPDSLLNQLADVENWVAKHIVKPEVSVTE